MPSSESRLEAVRRWKRVHPGYQAEWMASNRERTIYYGMVKRCLNPHCKDFKYYGGRGIRMEYKSYAEFIDDVGPRPGPEYSVDRIDNGGHYAPGNCRWATMAEQCKNRRART